MQSPRSLAVRLAHADSATVIISTSVASIYDMPHLIPLQRLALRRIVHATVLAIQMREFGTITGRNVRQAQGFASLFGGCLCSTITS